MQLVIKLIGHSHSDRDFRLCKFDFDKSLNWLLFDTFYFLRMYVWPFYSPTERECGHYINPQLVYLAPEHKDIVRCLVCHESRVYSAGCVPKTIYLYHI